MMATQARRPTHQGNPTFHPAPNAALLIDFDNVTMGIRSDLGKELKSLLNSDVIRGKVAVQRAYADWRRYPQYIVPLAESSIDLIFAPAYGSSKKNATDLRMAIDAIELVFTRPEIGTFILMTGDSDFSSCVLKLKEYGKYVIGVGMRESSSDLLIQNCDEYYSYHSLSGLTRTSEEEGTREDPWALALRAAQQMAANGDTMRADRLKQVMLDIDPSFNEKNLGYSKFSRFVAEAATKGLLRLKKLDNGQHEIVLDRDGGPERGTEAEAAAPRESRRGRRRETSAEAPRVNTAATPPEIPAEPVSEAREAPADLESAYALLQQAVRALAGGNGKGVRDGDVKRKMLDLVPGFDESTLGFSKFSRFLRQAHDAEIIDLHRVSSGQYEVRLSSTGRQVVPPVREPEAEPVEQTPGAGETPPADPSPPARRLHTRLEGRRVAPEGPPPLLPGQTVTVPGTRRAEPEMPGAVPEEEPTATGESTTEAAETAAVPAEKRRRGRRGRRRATSETPPELLPGQVLSAPEVASETPQEEPAAKEKPAARRSRSRTRKPKSEPVAPTLSTKDLGLPRDRDAISAYLANSYKGVGKKTAESLLEAFGEDLFQTMQDEPARVREVLGERRGNALLEQWAADRERRLAGRAEQAAGEPASRKPAEAESGGDATDEANEAPSGRGRTRRRGGRGRGRSRKTEPATT